MIQDAIFKQRYSHSCADLIRYIEKQTKELQKKQMQERCENLSQSGQERYLDYLDYLENREGSFGLFSYPGADIENMKTRIKQISFENDRLEKEIEDKYPPLKERTKEQKLHLKNEIQALHKKRNAEGKFFYIPYVSLTEESGDAFDIRNAKTMEEKARRFMKEYSKQTGIPLSNLEWMAAYHEKKVVENVVAGHQPHLHFIIYQKHPVRTKTMIAQKKLDNIYNKTKKLFREEYDRKLYFEKNKFKEDLEVGFDKKIHNKNATKIMEIQMELAKATNKKGKKTYKFLQNDIKKLKNIRDTYSSTHSLSNDDSNFLKRYNIQRNELYKLDEKITLLEHSLNKVDEVVLQIINSPDLKELYKDWIKTTSAINDTKSDAEKHKATEVDIERLKEKLSNKILKYDEKQLLNEIHIDTDRKEEFVKTLEFAKFNDYQTDRNIIKVVDNLSTIAKSMDLSKQEVISKVVDILEKNNQIYDRREIQKIIDDRYKNNYKNFLSKEEYRTTIKLLNIPSNNRNPYYVNKPYMYKSYKNTVFVTNSVLDRQRYEQKNFEQAIEEINSLAKKQVQKISMKR